MFVHLGTTSTLTIQPQVRRGTHSHFAHLPQIHLSLHTHDMDTYLVGEISQKARQMVNAALANTSAHTMSLMMDAATFAKRRRELAQQIVEDDNSSALITLDEAIAMVEAFWTREQKLAGSRSSPPSPPMPPPPRLHHHAHCHGGDDDHLVDELDAAIKREAASKAALLAKIKMDPIPEEPELEEVSFALP